MTIKVIVNGANGRMGRETVKALQEVDDLECVAACGRDDDVIGKSRETGAQVVVDFTVPEVVFANSQKYIDAGLHPVIGATGLTGEQIDQLMQLAKKKQLGGVIAPNFSIAVVLMMQYAQQTAKYYANVEIIEMHHENKLDAPSGTALKTAEMIALARANTPIKDKAHAAVARGQRIDDVPVHSVRLPGCVAHQEVVFGGPGEIFTLRHDTIARAAFMPGVLLACRKVVDVPELYYGLEFLLD